MFRNETLQQLFILSQMNPIKEENREYLDSNIIHKMYKLSHPDLDLTMQRLRDRILDQFEGFRMRLIGALNHMNYFRYLKAFPQDDIKFIFKERVNASRTESRLEEKQQIMQRMKNFEPIKMDYCGISDNCIYEIEEYITESAQVLNWKNICPSGLTYVSQHRQTIEELLPFIDQAPEEVDTLTLLKEVGQNFPSEQIRKLGSIFAMANKKVVSAKLLFRASEHGFQSAAFKQHCAGRSPTLMIAKSDKGLIFGGFTPCKWIKTKEKEYVNDPTAQSFLFSLNRTEMYKIKENQKNYAISAYGGWGPIYGSPYGPDLSISDKCHVNDHSCSSLGSHYQIPPHIKQYSNEAFSLLAGSKKFKVLQYDVYELILEQ